MATFSFIKDNFSFIIYGLALVLSIYHYNKYFDSILKYLPIVIGYTLLTEILGLLIKNNEKFAINFGQGYSYYNALIYNIFDIIFYLYFFYIYWKVLKKPSHKKWVKNGAIIYIVVSLVNPFFQDFYLSPQIYAMFAGSTILTICTVLYFKQLYYLEKNKNHNLLFWVSIGLLAFYPFYPIIFSIVVYFKNTIYQKFHISLVLQILISIMYICFIIGFIKMRRVNTITESS